MARVMQPLGVDQFDLSVGNIVAVLKTGLHAVRNLRASIIDLAYSLHDYPDLQGLLVLIDPAISRRRLKQEWDLASRTLRPEVLDRMKLAYVEAGEIRGYPAEPPAAIMPQLEASIREAHDGRRQSLPRTDFQSEILKLLIHQWLGRAGSLTTHWISETVGCTYPTTSKVLERLSSVLRRHSNRSIELAAFPMDQWAALVARGDEARHTLRFCDRSGQPRSVDALTRRLRKLDRKDLAIGGAIGARGHYPDLDLLGAPRLDLTIHCPGGLLDTDFIKRLDPALAPATGSHEPPAVVLHVLRRKVAYFASSPDGGYWADPVECLLDLHEARLEPQAKEFFDHLVKLTERP